MEEAREGPVGGLKDAPDHVAKSITGLATRGSIVSGSGVSVVEQQTMVPIVLLCDGDDKGDLTSQCDWFSGSVCQLEVELQ